MRTKEHLLEFMHTLQWNSKYFARVWGVSNIQKSSLKLHPNFPIYRQKKFLKTRPIPLRSPTLTSSHVSLHPYSQTQALNYARVPWIFHILYLFEHKPLFDLGLPWTFSAYFSIVWFKTSLFLSIFLDLGPFNFLSHSVPCWNMPIDFCPNMMPPKIWISMRNFNS